MNKRTAKPEPATPVETPTINDADLAALGAAGQEMTAGEFVGTRMNYAKGKWTKSAIQKDEKTDVPLPPTDSYIVDPLSVAYAWKKWIDKKLVAQIGPGRPVDGFIMPPRERLPDQDKTKWPWKGGKQEDPWQASAQITMKHADTAELFTWITTSWGGRRAIGNLLKTFAAQARKHSGQYPKVILKSRSEPHPDYGTIDKPILEIVDWAAFGDSAAPGGTPLWPQQALPHPAQEVLPPPKTQQSARGDMDDEIPF